MNRENFCSSSQRCRCILKRQMTVADLESSRHDWSVVGCKLCSYESWWFSLLYCQPCEWCTTAHLDSKSRFLEFWIQVLLALLAISIIVPRTNWNSQDYTWRLHSVALAFHWSQCSFGCIYWFRHKKSATYAFREKKELQTPHSQTTSKSSSASFGSNSILELLRCLPITETGLSIALYFANFVNKVAWSLLVSCY